MHEILVRIAGCLSFVLLTVLFISACEVNASKYTGEREITIEKIFNYVAGVLKRTEHKEIR